MSVPSGRPAAFSRPLYLLSATNFFIFMGAGAQQAYLVPYLGRVTGWPSLRCATVVAGVYGTMMVFRVANLYLFPGWPDRRFTVAGSLAYLFFTLAMFATAYLQSYAFALAAACIWGAGAAMMWTGTAMQTLALADAAGGRHGTGIGILYASTHAGWLAGVVLLGQVYQALPAEQAQYMYLVAAAATAVGNALACRLPAGEPTARVTPTLAEVVRIMTRPRALIAGVFQFTSALAFGLIIGLFSSFIQRQFGREWIWISVALYPATLMVMSAIGGHMTDRLGQAPTLFAGFAAGCLGLLVTVLWPHPYSVVFTGFTLGLLGSTVPIVASAMVGDAADRKRRPLAYGAVFTWRDLGVLTAALGSNLLGLQFDVGGVFTVFVAVFAGCALLSLALRRLAAERM